MLYQYSEVPSSDLFTLSQDLQADEGARSTWAWSFTVTEQENPVVRNCEAAYVTRPCEKNQSGIKKMNSR